MIELSWDELDTTYVPSDEEIRAWCRDRLDFYNLSHQDMEDFWESYMDPDGWLRYGGPDVYDAILYVMDRDPVTLADALLEYDRENRPMDPTRGPNQ